jgi:hypothetical protein
MILLIFTEMKKLIITSILTVLVTAGTTTVAQNYPDEYLGLPGDNLNLYAVMNLFQKSETLEGFERILNEENSRINNLDLNGDRMVDYIMVKDYIDGNVHNIVLRVALNRKDYQDVAVFTVQRFRNGSVEIQLIGDEALYGRNYIIEPIYADNYNETPNPGYNGSVEYRNNITVVRTSAFEIAAWPLIRFIFMPNYVVWHSSWHWGYYPSYWQPWHPYYWHYYYGYHSNWYPQYYAHYHHWNQNRYQHYNDFYYNNIRTHSPYVSSRIKEGHYKSTYSHPEQRRNGEALYAKMYPDNNKRTPDNTVNRSQERRSVSQQTQGKTISRESSGNTRRSANTSIDKGVYKPEKSQSSSSSRRTLNNYSKTTASESERSRYGGNSRNSTSNDSYKKVEKQDQANNAGTSRRSPVTISDKAASRPQQDQKAQSAGKSKQSTVNAGSSDRRSTKQSKTGPAVASRDNAKESATDKTSRRR